MRTFNQAIQTVAATSLILCASQLTFAAECSAKSGAYTTPLLELYTSEGCSSCPPADKWLSSLNVGNLTPLAFHVDYWDYIGWQDKFAKPQYSERQRQMARNAGTGFVYTPQFMLNGRDFKPSDSRLQTALQKAQHNPAQAHISLNAVPRTTGEMVLKTSVQLSKPELTKQANIFVALYENKLQSQVNAGENNGSTLKHDYVVRQLLGAYQADNAQGFSQEFVLPASWQGRNAGAVVFVQHQTTGEILQSLQLAFCGA